METRMAKYRPENKVKRAHTHKQTMYICNMYTTINLLENIFRFEHIVKSIWFMASK